MTAEQQSNMKQQEAVVGERLTYWQQAHGYMRGFCRETAAYEIRILRYMRKIAAGEMI